MPTHRDEVRAARGVVNRRASSLGINMDAERSKIGSNQRSLTFEAAKLINDQTPRTDREQLQVDDPPPVGAFDGVNTTFQLSEPVDGDSIVVIWGDTSIPDTIPLVKTRKNPPDNHSFFFDPNDPTVIVVGNPPLATDRLIAIYKAKR